MTARRGPLQEHNLGQQEPLSVHSDKLFHRHHWEMDLADVNKEGIRGFVDVCGLRGHGHAGSHLTNVYKADDEYYSMDNAGEEGKGEEGNREEGSGEEGSGEEGSGEEENGEEENGVEENGEEGSGEEGNGEEGSGGEGKRG
ncbi:hypothetical protein Pcinc_035573 [Petrolisthes cinctipes]|uniref:Uncharacterized protein n=1 Tax=Petrolisthes cinctipes TaxID=88211 RepID=A0AAE1BXG3_PETCI|nr:hypothetical protein Pcinc_035573 [Petrolisthes cinctipes]